MIDLHCHVLPGIDDGPATIEDSLALARAAANAGTSTIVATPHVSWDHRNSADAIARLAVQLNAALRAKGVPIAIETGAEIAMTRVGDIDTAELRRLTLGGRGQWLLIEPPFTPVASGLEGVIADLQQRGFRILLAHPERSAALHRDRAMLERLVATGVLGSLTAGSLDGKFGSAVRRFSLELVRDELVHNVASDAHDEVKRAPTILGELERAGLTALTEWSTEAVPAAILSGGTIPPRPQVASQAARRGRRWLPGRA
jgi:protein-tyrosine phosphatase